jgi:hypothetical protein
MPPLSSLRSENHRECEVRPMDPEMNTPCPILFVILSERSESKDLRLRFWRKGGKPQNQNLGLDE